MLKAMRNELRLSGRFAAFCGIFTFGMYILGLIMLTVILKIEPEEETTFFPMGSLLAALGGLFGQIIYDGLHFSTGYSLAVVMSRRRLPQILGHIVIALLRMVAVFAVVYLLMCLDGLLASAVYSGREVELDLRDFVSPGIVAAYIIVPVVLSLLVSAVKLRFGQRGWLVMYFIIFFGSMSLPRLIEMAVENPEHPVSRVLRAIFIPLIGIMSPALLIAFAVVACAAILLVSLRMMVRAQVNVD